MNLRCRLLSLVRLHHPDCEDCNTREVDGHEMRKRLEDLNWRTQSHSLRDGNQEEVVKVFDYKPGEVVASPPISLAQQKKTA